MLSLTENGLLPLHFVCGGHFISDGERVHKDRVRDDHEIIFVTEGVLRIAVGDTAYEVAPMEGLLIPAGYRHYGTASTEERVSFYWLHVIPRGAVGRKPEPMLFAVPRPEQFLQLFRHALHIAASMLYAPEAADYAAALLFLELEAQLRMAEHRKHPRLNEICEWIRLHPGETGSADGLARRFGYNEDYLCRLFKSAFGMTLKQYISKSKMRRAKALLLTTSLSVREIAGQVGMADEKVFYKAFKASEGITPSRFRNSYPDVSVNME